MVEALIVGLLTGLIVIGILISPMITRWRRNRLKQRPMPPLWQAIIEHHVPVCLKLSPEERRRLQGHIQVFLAEKQFIGCGGLQITDEIRLTIGAIACLLLMNEPEHYFPKLRSILVYPGAYWVKQTTNLDGYVVTEQRVARLGESWSRDQVVLSWENVKYDTTHWQDGHNVVLHEFAHQLDQADGRAEGVPILPRASDYAKWATIMTTEYQQLCDAVERGATIVIHRYGTTNPAEFFAVATETFFEAPQPLLQKHPALYEQLQEYYQLNPAKWT